jgi:hypothetical protein
MSEIRTRLTVTFAIVALVTAACGTAATTESIGAATPSPAAGASASAPPQGNAIAFEAASATIEIDGSNMDWDAIDGATVTLEQLRLAGIDPAQAAEIEFGPLDPIDVTLKVANDGDKIYALLEVPDDFDYDPADHNKSPSIAVMFRVDQPAAPHMGAEEPDIDRGLGMVDMWHWELDCGPGLESGGKDITGGDDPACNLDDEYSTSPSDREDDGGGSTANSAAENSLLGVWTHTGQASGAGAPGTWIFEMSRPLQTGDAQDGQFEAGQIAYVALAYFDPDESTDGWTDVGHLQSAYSGWIEVTIK